MAYRRFKLQCTPATVATTATLHDARPQSVAEVATVAGDTAENLKADPRTVADVAEGCAASIPIALATDTAIALERTVARLRSMGCCVDEAQGRALAIVRADLRNSPALFIQQWDLSRCHFCGEGAGEHPFIAVLSAMPNRPHWLHPCCHAEHVRRLSARVDTVLRGLELLLLTDPPPSNSARHH